MRFFTRIAVLFYVTLVMFLGTAIVLFVFNYLSFDQVSLYLRAIYTDQDLRFIFGIVGIVFLLLNFLFYKMFSVNVHKEKIIAFDNPSGRVSVSLIALEDLIKRLLFKMPEINEVKPSITASKKGLVVKLRVVFSAEVNIPESTSKVQEAVKRKVHDTIGLDEEVSVSVYVGKILSSTTKEKPAKIKPEESGTNDPEVPFRGYRR